MAKREEAYEPVTVETLGDLRKFLKEVEEFPDDTKVTGSYEGRADVNVVINGGWPPNTMPSVWVGVEEIEEDLT